MSARVFGVVLVLLVCGRQLNAGHKTDSTTTHHPQTTTKNSETLSPTARIKLHDSLRNILGFHDLPLGSEILDSGKKSHTGLRSMGFDRSGSKDQVAPRYMMRLYDQFRAGRVDRQRANTVRSIQPDVVLVNNQGMFLLNLTSIRPSEHVLRAEVHIYKRRQKSGHHTPSTSVNIDVYAITPQSSEQLWTHTITQDRTGWQTFDVTSQVDHCIAQRQSARCLLGLHIAANDKTNVSLPMAGAEYSRPYLVIFSNDTLRVSVDHLDHNLNGVYQSEDSYINPGNGLREHFNDRSRKRRPFGGKHTPRPRKSARDARVSQFETRKRKLRETRQKRSIYDNEIPDHVDSPVVPNTKYNIPDTDPRILQTRAQNKQTATRSRLIPYPEDDDDDEDDEEEDDDDDSHIQRQRTNSRRRKNRRRKKNRRRNKNSGGDSMWATDGDGLPYLKANRPRNQNRHAEMCGRKSLRIDFADIGWSEWIIAPKSFEAHYCSGVCQFPAARRLMTTNHATLQSLVEAVGIRRDIPAPCCAPDKLSSLSLIFFDQSQNVVLKSYDGMTVKSCGCH